MTQVDFLIANTGHHLDAARPVVEELSRRGIACRFVSLCELRGLRSPEASTEGVEVHRLIPHLLRRSPSQGGGTSTPGRRFRALPREFFWRGYLGRRVRAWLRSKPDLVTVPNDAAFPYDRICRELARRDIRFLLLQEGIRFAETVFEDSEILGQGLSGADAIACWGESSAEFFRARGAPPASIHLTGSPRFDRLHAADWNAQALKLSNSLPPADSTVAVLTNPIDVWGFCSRREKMELLERFLDGLDTILERRNIRVLFKIHRQESLYEYQTMVARADHADRIRVLEDAPLYPLLHLSDAAIVLASTVGLEALLLGVPLGVLELPGFGFAHDFVSSGAARGISWNKPIADQVGALLDDVPSSNPRLEHYLDRSLHARGGATREVVELIGALLAGRA